MTEIFVVVKKRTNDGDLSGFSSLEPLAQRIDDVTAALKEISIRVGGKLEDLAQTVQQGFSLEEIELKVSLDLASEARVIVAKASATAGFEASLKWKRT